MTMKIVKYLRKPSHSYEIKVRKRGKLEWGDLGYLASFLNIWLFVALKGG